MALDALLASLESETARKADAVVHAARAEAARRVTEALAARERRLADAVVARRAEREAQMATVLAAVRQAAERDVLAARDEALASVRDRARRCLAAAADDAALATVGRLVRTAAGYLDEAGGEVRCAPAFRAALEPVAQATGLTLVLEPAMDAGAWLRATDGRVAIDATLPTLLDRHWADEAIRLAPLLEPAR